MARLKQLPLEDYPFEKALKYGLAFLTTSELLALILWKGVKGANVLEISQNLLDKYKNLSTLSNLSLKELCKNKGINKVKAMQILASLMLATKLQSEVAPTLTLKNYRAIDVYNNFIHYFLNSNSEIIYLISLNNLGKVIKTEIFTSFYKQSIDFSETSLYELTGYDVKKVILLHNHLNADIEPTFHDIDATISLFKKFKSINILFLDHLIICKNKFYSFRENNILPNCWFSMKN